MSYGVVRGDIPPTPGCHKVYIGIISGVQIYDIRVSAVCHLTHAGIDTSYHPATTSLLVV